MIPDDGDEVDGQNGPIVSIPRPPMPTLYNGTSAPESRVPKLGAIQVRLLTMAPLVAMFSLYIVPFVQVLLYFIMVMI